jgi:MFS family permease
VVPLYAASLRRAGAGRGDLRCADVVHGWCRARYPRTQCAFGYRLVFVAGLLLLGAPAPALIGSASIAAILSVSFVRGLGFGIVTVLGSALVASLVPNERRGGALGVYGDVIGVPSVLALPLGVWLVGTSGIEPRSSPERWPRFAGTAVVAALIGRAPKPEEMIGVVSDLRTPALARLSLKFAVAAMGAGVVVTFMPVAERFVSTLRPDVSTESSSSGV